MSLFPAYLKETTSTDVKSKYITLTYLFIYIFIYFINHHLKKVLQYTFYNLL